MSNGTAGLLVSAYAVMVAVLSVPLALATRRLPRKPVLLATIGGYGVSNVVAALAPTFGVLAAGRVIGGITHALFFSVCIGYAARLVPATQTGRAMALASVGVSGGLVLGVPLSTALGAALGWRAAFGGLAVLVALVLVMAAVVLPPVDGPRGDDAAAPGAASQPRHGGHGERPHLPRHLRPLHLRQHPAARLRGGRALGRPTLLLFGVCGLVGLRVAAAQLDHRPRGSAILDPCADGCGLAAPWRWPTRGSAPVVVAGMVWLAAFGPAASLYQSASVRTTASSPETAGAGSTPAATRASPAGPRWEESMASSGLTWVALASAAIVTGPPPSPSCRGRPSLPAAAEHATRVHLCRRSRSTSQPVPLRLGHNEREAGRARTFDTDRPRPGGAVTGGAASPTAARHGRSGADRRRRRWSPRARTAETVEQISGFFIVTCDDYDALVEAAEILTRAHPVVEIRPVQEF